ncbi:MAG TPA: aminotransferase class V-fold PLP-dependent enzyme, partial [bacterium]
MDPRWRFTTRAVHGGQIADTHKSVVPPIYQTATFYYDTAEEGARLGQEVPPGFVYTRWANPTTRVFETKVAVLEGAEDALATASGMAAVSTAVVASLRRGDHAVTPSAVYQATYLLFAQILPEFGIETTVISGTSLEAYERALRPNTRLLYIETPNNPVLGITDIAGLVDLARRHGARTIADNTFATPYNQTPLALGVDTVVHSATKYLAGHHDLTAGVIAGSSHFLQRAKRYLRIFGA